MLLQAHFLCVVISLNRIVKIAAAFQEVLREKWWSEVQQLFEGVKLAS